jgi:hypothetical protein
MTLKGNKTKSQRAMETEQGVKQLQMATRVSQMLIQQMGQSVQSMGRDMNEITVRQRELQYKVLAIQELMNIDADAVTRRAEALQIKDFEETSAKEDVAQECTDADEVTEDSVIVLTSKVEAGGGILRTRLKVAELGFPQLKQDLLGKKVGDTIEADINGTKHSITLLGIKKLPVKVEDVGQPEQAALCPAPAAVAAAT